MRVAEILAKGPGLLGKRLHVEGYFVMVGEQIYIVNSIEQRDDLHVALALRHNDLQDLVMSKVPPSGGSKYYYLDAAEVTGVLAVSEDARFPFFINELEILDIQMSGFRIAVLP